MVMNYPNRSALTLLLKLRFYIVDDCRWEEDMNRLLRKELEAQMLKASARLSLEELNASKPKEYLEAFYDGYMFRSEMINLANDIYFRGDKRD